MDENQDIIDLLERMWRQANALTLTAQTQLNTARGAADPRLVQTLQADVEKAEQYAQGTRELIRRIQAGGLTAAQAEEALHAWIELNPAYQYGSDAGAGSSVSKQVAAGRKRTPSGSAHKA